MNHYKKICKLFLALLLVANPAISQAAVPEGINYQAYLTDDTGAPVNSDVSITFAAYNVDVGGVPLWSATQLVSPDDGLFSITLGTLVNPFPTGLFDTPVFIGLFVAGEEMLPRRALTSSPFAYKAADADTLTGVTAAELDQSGEVSDLQSDVASIQSEVSLIDSAVTNNTSSINTVQGDVTTNVSVIGGIEGALDVVDDRLAVLEASPGDITGVTAGSGLSGGASSGNATISITNGGITSQMIGANAIGSANIVDGSVTGSDLNSNSNYVLGDTDVDDLTVTAALVVDSPFDITIRDDFNGFRWRTSDGLTALASITVRSNDVVFRDDVRSQTIFESNDNGIGIGTPTPTAGFDVTIPSLIVTGNIDIGRERVVVNYDLDIMTASCHSHGNLPCYNNSVTVTCPVGKKVLGGGAQGSSARFGNIGSTYPGSDTSFFCSASYDIANASRNCVAICARVE